MTTAQNALVPFLYRGIHLLETAWINGEPWFTRTAIGKWLHYKHPWEAISKIEQRHPQIKAFSTQVKLTWVEGNRKVERERTVYSFIGLQLIIAYSNRPQRDIYLMGVAHALDALQKGQLLPSRWCAKGDRISAIQQLLSWPPNYSRRGVVKYLAKREGVSISTVYYWTEQSGQKLLTKSGKPRRTRSDKGKTIYPEYKALILAYKKSHPEKGYKQIATEMGLTRLMGCIQHWLKAA